MRRFLDRLYTWSGVLAALCVFAIFILMMASALGREVGVLVRGADDIVAWLCAGASFLALGHTFRHGELVRVGLWLDHLGPRARRWMEIFALGFTAIFVAYMLWAVCSFIYDSYQFNEVAQGLIQVPIWIPQMTFLVGVVIFFVAVLDELYLVIRNEKPAYQVAEEERRASGDFSEST